jgi:hypothetical protein
MANIWLKGSSFIALLFMKNFLLLAFFLFTLISCTKDQLVKNRTWVSMTYRIQTLDSNLMVSLMRGEYTDNVKGNIAKDTLLVNPGFYNIPVSVLVGHKVTLFGMSTRGPDFELAIHDEEGVLLKKTDSITFYPKGPFDTVDRWVSKITVIPD